MFDMYIPEEDYQIVDTLQDARKLEDEGWDVKPIIIYICTKKDSIE